MPQATPGARQLAVEAHVDLLDVIGTGKSEYILVGDVKKYIESNREPEPVAPFLPPSEHEDFEHLDLSPVEVRELVKGVVFPVSLLAVMRFRDDHWDGTKWSGDDLLALRPKTAAGRYRSNDGILGWFVSDRGFFADPEPTPVAEPEDGPTPIPTKSRDNGTEPDQLPADPNVVESDQFAVSTE